MIFFVTSAQFFSLQHREISTLIKIRGANFQNKTRKSYATLRVNRYKHLVSLVARIGQYQPATFYVPRMI